MPRFRRRAARTDTAPLPRVEQTEEGPREAWVEEGAPPPPPGRPPPPHAWWPWLLVLLLLVVAGLVALVVLQQDDDDEAATEPPAATATEAVETETVTVQTEGDEAATVPDVVGVRLPQALEQLQEAGFVGNPRGVFSDEAAGTVVSQRPEPGADANEGTEVRLNVSKGAQRIDVPDVVGLPRSEAESLLREAGFEVRPFEVPSGEPKGTVVAQNPPGGSRAAEGDSVRINLSTGRAGTAPAPVQVTVPDMVGLPLRQASRQLREEGFVVRVFYVPSGEREGTIVAQRPSGGATARRGASVRLNVSEGPRPEERVVVPDVLGLTEQEAVAELEAVGFEVEVIAEPTPDEAEQGIVLRQEPEPGGRAPRGALVTVYVGEFTA
jgi:beta-lactam-binding protein with PASTA domain